MDFMTKLTFIFLLFFIAQTDAVSATKFDPNFDPQQTIAFWEPHIIDPLENENVAFAHVVFDQLLRAWDSSRLEPKLYVVSSDRGPWAASLEDGSILLSSTALEFVKRQNENHFQHRLAFMLAHEISHQRSDDLWHQKYFRLAGNQVTNIKDAMVEGLSLVSEQDVLDLEKREARADTDGIILMSIVGYDPLSIIQDNDFFSAWAEAIWQTPCNDIQKLGKNDQACRQAKSRASRVTGTLLDVAAKSTLFELGVQSYVMGSYQTAIDYFTAFGQDYPHSQVYSNIGVSHLTRALQLRKMLSQKHKEIYDLYFPVILSSKQPVTASIKQIEKVAGLSRSLTESTRDKLHKKMINQHVDLAINAFERAIKLDPDNPINYLHLSSAFLLQNNVFMSRGILQGKYLARFQQDRSAEYLLALIDVVDGNTEKAITSFNKLLSGDKGNNFPQDSFSNTLLLYGATYNINTLTKQNVESKQNPWVNLANIANASKNPLLFRMAIAHVNQDQIINSDQNINSLKIAIQEIQEKMKASTSESNFAKFYVKGNLYRVAHLADDTGLVLDQKNRIKSLWKNQGTFILNNRELAIGDNVERAYKTIGIPDRHISLQRGDYLAYDDLDFGVFVRKQAIQRLFMINK